MPPVIYPNYHLLVMSKAPVLGRVKTRMQPALSQEQSLNLHITLTQYAIKAWLTASLCPVSLWVGGDQALFQQQILVPLAAQEMNIYTQVDGDLGARMAYALQTAEQDTSTKGMILVGTDCPFIDRDYLHGAISALESGENVVVGPANDGGYVLLGVKTYHPRLFEDIDWGTESVLGSTLDRVRELGLSYRRLSPLVDIDLVSDLAYLAQLPDIDDSPLKRFIND